MKVLSKYSWILLLLFSSIFANEEKRIDFETRKFTNAQKKEIEINNKKNILLQSFDNQYPPLVYNHYIHNLIGISALGDYLIIEDGSQWKIKKGYEQEAFLWQEKDPIMIVMNDSYISSYFGYKYKMLNARTNTTIEVKLFLGPVLDNSYTLQIVALNAITHEIILSDNTLWQCDPSQYDLFNKWAPGDAIIVGTNVKGWFNNSYENLLININLLQEIKANRLE
jgi:hypothetical protein